MTKTFKFESGDRKAVGSFNAEYEEWTVKFYVDGKRLKKANYFTDDRADAACTAERWVARNA